METQGWWKSINPFWNAQLDRRERFSWNQIIVDECMAELIDSGSGRVSFAALSIQSQVEKEHHAAWLQLRPQTGFRRSTAFYFA